MSAIPSNFGFGGANLVPGGAGGKPTLAEALRDVADDLAETSVQVPAWVTGVAVSTDTCEFDGWVLAVQATTASSTGPKQMIQGGSPATGEVSVDYDANGKATLTFNSGTDAVTEAAILGIPRTAGYTRKTTKA